MLQYSIQQETYCRDLLIFNRIPVRGWNLWLWQYTLIFSFFFEKNVNCVLLATICLRLGLHPWSWYQFPLHKNHCTARKIHDLEQVCVCFQPRLDQTNFRRMPKKTDWYFTLPALLLPKTCRGKPWSYFVPECSKLKAKNEQETPLFFTTGKKVA